MSYDEQIEALNERRMHAWSEQKRLLDHAVEQRRALTAEERQESDLIDKDMDSLKDQVDQLERAKARSREMDGLRAEFDRIRPSNGRPAADPEVDAYREFFRPGGRTTSLDIDLRPAARAMEAWRAGARGEEFRAVIGGDTGASGGSLTIPTQIATDIYSFMTAAVAMRRTRATIIQTAGGQPIKFPRTSTHGIATQVANQDTAFAGTDPVLADMTLNAYDYGQLVAVAADLLEDSGSNIIGYVSQQLGRAIGEVTATDYVSGSGSSKPNGLMTAITGSGTIATGAGSLTNPTFEKLIDLVYSVNGNYRARGAEFLMRDLTTAIVRKIRDGAGGTIGAFLWQPSPTAGLAGGEPDRLLGYPVWTDPNVASIASGAKTIAFGDFSAYYIRDVGNLRLERSDDYLFNKNQVAFRALLRTDGDLIDTNAVNAIVQHIA
jgi:HK97 family phage major capsid protein